MKSKFKFILWVLKENSQFANAKSDVRLFAVKEGIGRITQLQEYNSNGW